MSENSNPKRSFGGACLLLHGIAAGPAQFDNLTAELDARGIPWRTPVLPGHGTNYKDLFGVTWRDWYDTALTCHRELEREYGTVAVAGFSIGSLLAIMLAAERPVERLVLLNTPVYSFFRFIPAGLFLRVLGMFTKEIRTFAPPDGVGRVRIYRRVPVCTLRTMAELVEAARPDIPGVTSPCLIVHSKFDLASRAKSASYLLENLGSSQKGIYWLRSRDHSILEGDDHRGVVGRVGGFIAGEHMSGLRGA